MTNLRGRAGAHGISTVLVLLCKVMRIAQRHIIHASRGAMLAPRPNILFLPCFPARGQWLLPQKRSIQSHSSKVTAPPREKVTVAVKQVILSSSLVTGCSQHCAHLQSRTEVQSLPTSAKTVYFPYRPVSMCAGKFAEYMFLTHRRDLIWQIDILGQAHLSLLQWALQVHILDRIAQVCRLPNDGDKAVFDLKMNLCPFFDVLGESTVGSECEGRASVHKSVWCAGLLCSSLHVQAARYEQTYAFGGFGERSTFVISRMSWSGSAQ